MLQTVLGFICYKKHQKGVYYGKKIKVRKLKQLKKLKIEMLGETFRFDVSTSKNVMGIHICKAKGTFSHNKLGPIRIGLETDAQSAHIHIEFLGLHINNPDAGLLVLINEFNQRCGKLNAQMNEILYPHFISLYFDEVKEYVSSYICLPFTDAEQIINAMTYIMLYVVRGTVKDDDRLITSIFKILLYAKENCTEE